MAVIRIPSRIVPASVTNVTTNNGSPEKLSKAELIDMNFNLRVTY